MPTDNAAIPEAILLQELPDLSLDELLKVEDLVIERVQVPEWKGSVYVRSFTAGGRDKFDQVLLATKESGEGVLPTDARAKLVSLTCCDAKGNLIFNDSHISWLSQRNYEAMDRIFTASLRLNKLQKDAAEDAAKNLKPVPSDDSSS